MATYACIIQSNQAAEAKQAELADGLARVGRDLLNDPVDGIDIRWVVVPEGFAFTAGEPSTTSLIIRSVPSGYPTEDRHRLLMAISDMWQEVTACSANEVVVTAYDGPLPI